MRSDAVAVGLDLGGTTARAGLVSADGSVRARVTAPTPAREGADAVVACLAGLVRTVTAAADGASVVGIGLSSPGPLDAENGIALAVPTIAGFVDFPVAARLAEATGLAVRLENDAIAAAVGEWRFGAGRGLANMVYVTVSTGVGGGAVVDGRVLRGRKGMAAHVGHMTVVQGGALCSCGNHGCFEAYASGTAFVARAQRLAAGDVRSALHGGEGSAAAVFAAAAAGDALAATLVAEEAGLLGLGFANLLHLYSPDVLVMGGGMANQFDALEPGIVAAITRHAMPPFRDVPVVRAGLGDNSGLAGAAALAFDAAAAG